MRELQRTERMHLPREAGEEWLDSQKPKPTGAKHRKPPEDAYAAWLKKRVDRKLKARAEG